ncbi:aldehyde dehydrogenase family protein [Alkalicoccus urumqiensis]|uniref:Aldehyde dehydrogenase EutE n=1 Tax=Alkalicoccus urumqiensis TaxID=1548213 RepID=A0A2P6MIW5_ALKUR|nr:aldehyde dehydrogenase family protein [Alkalicoccus urumqiensis]PRO66210.1 aldehyde dehydrogenase EutE [Alkalicoccus urumqiensis]
MKLSEQQIQSLVEKVVSEVAAGNSGSSSPAVSGHGVFRTVSEAVAAAEAAERKMRETDVKTRKKMIEAMRKTSRENARALAETAVNETGLGRIDDKEQKNLLAAEKTPGVEDLQSMTYTGDDGLTLVEPSPFGIFGAITPTTNPGATIINNSLSLVAAGNVVVYNPHPGAKRVSLQAMSLLNDAIVEAGGPENVLTAVSEPTLETSTELMNHPEIRALVVTGGGAVVKAAMSTGKKVIAAGPGNPPVVVDETAKLDKAARDIVLGASFDNNVLCTAEKELYAVQSIAEDLKNRMIKNGAYELKGHQLKKVLDLVLVEKDGKVYPNKSYVGKDASVIMEAAGLRPDPDVRLLIAETKDDHPLVHTEMLMPILPLIRVKDVHEGIDLAVKAEKGNRHTAVMHSQNVSNLTEMAQRIDATIFVKNGPSLAGLGYESEGFATLTIAGPTGEGLTSPRTFTRERRCVLVDGLRII